MSLIGYALVLSVTVFFLVIAPIPTLIFIAGVVVLSAFYYAFELASTILASIFWFAVSLIANSITAIAHIISAAISH